MSIRRDTALNLGGQLAPLGIMLLTVPVYLGLIGEARYGVLAVAWMLLGYFGVFDLGLGRATAQRMARLRDASDAERAQLLWTALLINAGFGVAGALLLWGAGNVVLGRVITMDEGLRAEALSGVPWLALALPLTVLSSILSGALEGRERFLALNVSRVAGAAMSQLFPLAVAWLHTPHLGWLIPAALAARLVSTLVLFGLCRRRVPFRRGGMPDPRLARGLCVYGGWVTVSAVIGPLLSTVDRLLIGAVAGAQAVAYYNIPLRIASQVMAVPTSLSGALFPRFSAATDGKRGELSEQAIRAISVTLTPLVVVGLFTMEPFLTLWIDAEFAARSAGVGQILLLGLWANGLAVIPHVSLHARGRPEVVAKMHLVELIPYLGLLWGALLLWGIAGAALAWTVRMSAIAAVLFLADRTPLRRLSPLVVPVLLLAVSSAIVFGLPWQDGFRWAGSAILSGVTAAWAWSTAPAAVKESARAFLRPPLAAAPPEP